MLSSEFYGFWTKFTHGQNLHAPLPLTTNVICEYNDVLMSDSGGSFRFKPKKNDKNTEIQCFQQVKPGFEVKKHSRAYFLL